MQQLELAESTTALMADVKDVHHITEQREHEGHPSIAVLLRNRQYLTGANEEVHV